MQVAWGTAALGALPRQPSPPRPAHPHPPPTARADTSVSFRVTLSEAKMREALAAGLLDKFKLRTKISTGAAGQGHAKPSQASWTAFGGASAPQRPSAPSHAHPPTCPQPQGT